MRLSHDMYLSNKYRHAVSLHFDRVWTQGETDTHKYTADCMGDPQPQVEVGLPCFERAPAPGMWRLDVIRHLRDILADAHILPLAVLDVIAEYAVFTTVVVHASARVGVWNPTRLARFRVYPWNSLRVLDAVISAKVNAPFRWRHKQGVYFILRYTMMIGNTEFPIHSYGRIQVGRLLYDLGVGWNQVLNGEFHVHVELVRLRVLVTSYPRGPALANGGVRQIINSVLARAGWPSWRVLRRFEGRHEQAGVEWIGHRPHRLTLQEAEQAKAREVVEVDSLVEAKTA